MTDDKSNQLRAVFLAALMVLWVFAGTVAFAGGAAAVSDGDLDNTSVDNIGDNSVDATTTYNISTEFTGTNDPAGSNPSGVSAVELDFSDAATFGGNVDNFTSSENVTVVIDDPNAGAYGETTNPRTVPLQDNFTENGDTIALDFQEKENVSDDATLYVNFTDPVIQNPSVGDTYEVQFRSYTDAGTSGDFKAQNASYTISGDGGGTTEDSTTDTDYAGNKTVWKGQILDFTARPAQCNATRTSYSLNYWTPDETVPYGSTITEFSLNSSDGAQIPTKNVADDQQVVITANNEDSGSREIVDVGNGTNSGTQTSNCWSNSTTGDDPPGINDWVRVTPQTLSANFTEDSIASDQNATLNVESNRNGYDVYVASDDFTQSELRNIVEGSNTNVDSSRAPDRDAVVRVNGISNDENLNMDLRGFEAGNYSFTLKPTDTLPTDSAQIEITEAAAGDGQFDSENGAFSVKRGDIQSPEGDDDATISVNKAGGVDHVVIVIGDEDRNNYQTRVVAQPDDDGRVDIRMNTFLAGRLNATNESQAFTATSGTIVSVQRSSPKLTGVLDEGQYDLRLENTDGQQFDAGVLNIRESSYNNLTEQRHPDVPLNTLDSKSELAATEDLSDTKIVTMTDRDRSGQQRDVLVHTIDISGIYGALAAIANNPLDSANGNQVLADAQQAEQTGAADDAVLEVNLTQINFRQNREPKEAGFANPAATDQFRFVIDEDNETLYLVTDIRTLDMTRETGTGPEQTQINAGDDFEFTFDVGPGFENAYKGGIDTYVPSGGTTTQLDVEDREAEFDEQGADNVRVNPAANQTISGQTNVAPGTQVTIQVDSTSRTRRANDTETGDVTPVFQRATAEVQADGSFEDDSFDFSDNEVGRKFVVTSPGNGFEDDAEKPGIVVEGTPASASLSDITVPVDQDELSTITVDSVFLPQGGFVTIHDGSLADGAVFDSVRGTSDALEKGEHSNVEVTLDDPYTEDGTAIAMPHKDTNDNGEYDFVTSEGEADGPYTAGGEIVTASASVTFETPTPTATASPTPTESPTESPTASPTPTSEDQPGFGAALALIALIGAALLAARRRDF